MGELAEALAQYEQTIAGLGFDLFSTVRPGLERAEIVSQLEGAGVEPTEDVVDWFAFSNGSLPSVPGQPRLAGVFDDVLVVSLEDALTERTERLDPDFLLDRGLDESQVREMEDSDLIVPFEPSWMPISRGKQTCVIETDLSSERSGQLIALWTDELMPRIQAPSMVAWVERLTTDASSGAIDEYVPANARTIQAVFYGLGVPRLPNEEVAWLRGLVTHPFLRSHGKIRLKHATVGSLAGNGALEEIQARDLERVLRELGLDWCAFEYQPAAPEVDHHHRIEILGVVRSGTSAA